MIDRRMFHPNQLAELSPSPRRVAPTVQYAPTATLPQIGPTGTQPPGASTRRRLQRSEVVPGSTRPFRVSALHSLIRQLVTDENFARRVHNSPLRAFNAVDYLNDHERHILTDADPSLLRELAKAAQDYAISKQAAEVDVFGQGGAQADLAQAMAAIGDGSGGGGGRHLPRGLGIGGGGSEADDALAAAKGAVGDDPGGGGGGRRMPKGLGFGSSDPSEMIPDMSGATSEGGERGGDRSGEDTMDIPSIPDAPQPGGGRFGSGAQWTSQMRRALRPGEASADDKDAGAAEPKSGGSTGSSGSTTQSTQSSDKDFGSQSVAAQDARSESRVAAAEVAGAVLGAVAVGGTLGLLLPGKLWPAAVIGGAIAAYAGFRIGGEIQKGREQGAGHKWMPNDEGTGPVGPRIRPSERFGTNFLPDPDASGVGPGGPRLRGAWSGREAMPVPDEAGGGGPTGPWANVYKPDPESSSPGTPHSRALALAAMPIG